MLADAATECGLCNWTLVACLMGDGYVYKQCKNRYLLLLSQAQSPLTHAENEKLALAVRVFGYSWRSCARHFPGRSGRDLAERYRRLEYGEGKWTAEEDELLQAGVEKYGVGKWSRVARLLTCVVNLEAYKDAALSRLSSSTF